MKRKLQPDELEEELFLAMLDLSRANVDAEFDLMAVCNQLDIDAERTDLIRFTSDNEGIRGTGNNTYQSIRFTMNAEGRRHALSIEKARTPKTIRDRVSEIPIGKGIWDIAMLVVAAALGWFGKSYFGS